MNDNKIDKSNKILMWLNYLFGVVFIAVGAIFLIMQFNSDVDHPLLDKKLSIIVAGIILGYGILKIKLTYSKYKKIR